jgi:hypothetical protein
MTRWTKTSWRAIALGLLAGAAVVSMPLRPARADFVRFDPDGAGASPELLISQLNYSAGNALAQGALPLAVGTEFELLFQATLGSVTLSNGTQMTPAGLNGTGGAPAYEITIVARITETVSSITPGPTTATFQLSVSQAPTSFIEIYFDPLQDADPLTGTGFDNGTLIFSSLPDGARPNSGNFTFSETASPGSPDIDQFDRNGVNNYPGVSTVVGSGSSTLRGTPVAVNPLFFPGDTIIELITNAVNSTPFFGVDPSLMFDTVAGTNGPNYLAQRGTVNGLPAAFGGGPDFQFQAQINQSFVVVPEPASVVLMGCGIVGVLGYSARRSRKKAS